MVCDAKKVTPASGRRSDERKYMSAKASDYWQALWMKERTHNKEYGRLAGGSA